MSQDGRAALDRALERARGSAYAAGEFVGQESFMTAGEIRELAVRAGIGSGVTVLDLCCGVAGPGRFVTRELGCRYLGVDASASAVDLAVERAGDLACRFTVAAVPPLPAGPFDVVLLLETILAFKNKDALVREIFPALAPGGRFAFTLEEGAPLTGCGCGGWRKGGCARSPWSRSGHDCEGTHALPWLQRRERGKIRAR